MMFTGLPLEAQQVIARREQERDTTLRRGQNEIAEMKKRLQAAAAEPKPADETRKRIEDAEEERLERETRGLHDRRSEAEPTTR
jgi:hypothetical protein